MNVIDLCAGLGGATQAFKDRGHNVFTVDIEERFNPVLVADVRWLRPDDFPSQPDFIWASPPCTGFTVAAIGTHWKGGIPDDVAKLGITIVDACVRLCYSLKPKHWIMENPTGMLRKIMGPPDVRTFFCCWGMPNKKPTDLWGNLPPMDWPKPVTWERAPRGSNRGTQANKNPSEKAKIPYKLSLAVCDAMENVIVEESSPGLQGRVSQGDKNTNY